MCDGNEYERFVDAMKALSDGELMAVCQPLVDLQDHLLKGKRDRRRVPLVSIIGNEKCIEFYEAIGRCVLAELRYREDTLDTLAGA